MELKMRERKKFEFEEYILALAPNTRTYIFHIYARNNIVKILYNIVNLYTFRINDVYVKSGWILAEATKTVVTRRKKKLKAKNNSSGKLSLGICFISTIWSKMYFFFLRLNNNEKNLFQLFVVLHRSMAFALTWCIQEIFYRHHEESASKKTLHIQIQSRKKQ